MIYNEEIRRNIIRAIIECGISQTELAKLLNVKQPTIAQYISGRAMPSLDTFANLCEVLDLDSNSILGIDRQSNYKKKGDK